MGLFREPAYLVWALLALAASAALAGWSKRRRKRMLERFAGAGVLPRLFDTGALEVRRRRYLLRAAALVALLIALAGPQWGIRLVTTRSVGTQIMIAVDTSLSMLAEDLKPNRIERAKSALAQLINGLKGNRIGLIAFAGEAQVQCPLTTDSGAVKSFLRRIEAGMIPQQGTAIGSAVRLATSYLEKYPGHKAIVLLTDGEDHRSRPLEAVRAAAEAGVHVYILGMGTPEGEPIPVKEGDRITGYKKDSKGETVISRLNETGLIKLAAASAGAYYRATNSGEEVQALLRSLDDLEKSDIRSGAVNRYRNHYRYPLLLALILLALEMLIPETRRPAASAGRGSPVSLAVLALILSGCSMPSDLQLLRGNSKYRSEEFGEALKRYEKADTQDRKTPFNRGAALYKMGDYSGAEKSYAKLTDPDQVPEGMAPKSYYNLGNSLYKQKRFPEAADAYKRCLMLDPNEEDCRHNLVLALRPPPKGKKKDQKKPKKDKKDNQSKQQSSSARTKRNKQGELSKEDAERILQAVREKERAVIKNRAARQRAVKKSRPRGGEDW